MSEADRDHAVQWDEPLPLPAGAEGTLLDCDWFGDRIGAFVEAVAAETGTPVDLPAMGVLGACSSLIGGAVVVEADEGWREPVNLYGATIAAPGEGKTPAFARTVAPVHAIEADRRQEAAPGIQNAAALRRLAEARRTEAEKRAAKSTAENRLLAEEEALQASREMDSIVVPELPRIHTSDATPEAVVQLLGAQCGRAGVLSDEGAEFFEMAGRYASNGKANLGIYLAGFDGGRYVSDRVGRPSIVIPRVTLTVCLYAQPVVLENLGQDRQASGRGLLARFLWSLPTSLVGQRTVKRQPVPDHHLAVYDAMLGALAVEAEAIGEPIALTLDAEAARRFLDWRVQHEPRLAHDLSPVVEWASKLPGQVLRLAGNLHALRSGTITGTVSPEEMEAALPLADYFVNHAQRAFGVMRSDRRMVDAGAILRWAREREVKETTVRDLCRSKDWDADRVRDALDVLDRYGWAQKRNPDPAAGRGRPSEEWLMNPQISGDVPTKTDRNPFCQVLSRKSLDVPSYAAEDPVDDLGPYNGEPF